MLQIIIHWKVSAAATLKSKARQRWEVNHDQIHATMVWTAKYMANIVNDDTISLMTNLNAVLY